MSDRPSPLEAVNGLADALGRMHIDAHVSRQLSPAVRYALEQLDDAFHGEVTLLGMRRAQQMVRAEVAGRRYGEAGR